MSSGLDASRMVMSAEENFTITPPWKVWKSRGNGKGSKQEWFSTVLPCLQKLSESRIETHVNNLLWYTGEYDRTLEYRLVIPNRGAAPISRRMLPRIFNHIYDITEQRVSRLSRFKPSFDIIPTNREESDRANANLLKTALQATERRVRMDYLMQNVERWTAVFGEVLIDVEWNEWIGDRKSRSSTERVGDVDVRIRPPWYYFPEPKASWESVNWCIDIVDVINIEEARVIFKKPTLEPDGKRNIFVFNDMIEEKRTDEVVVYRLIQIPSRYYPEGCISFFINGEMVDEVSPYPYSHKQFPFERHTDLDVPGRLFPMSFYQQLIPVQHVYNRISSVMMRNMMYVGHPHILIPNGSGAKREAFGNAPSTVSYTPVAGLRPEILTFSSVPQEFFQFRTDVRNELNTLSGIQGVSRGAPPAGVRAASMLRFYSEQEDQRAGTQIIKHNETVRRIYQKAAGVIGDFYPLSKDRLLRVLGPENAYMIGHFDKAKFSSEYDVIIINSTGFSQDMSGRLDEIKLISELEKECQQQLLSPQEKADVLNLKDPQKAYDILTAAQRSAESNIERLRSGIKLPEPQPYWDLIVHWRTTIIFMNSPEWQNVPEDRRGQATTHLMMLERLMERKAKANQTFKSKLEMLEGYPAIWSVTPEVQTDTPKPEAPPAAAGPDLAGGMPPGMPPMGPPPMGAGPLPMGSPPPMGPAAMGGAPPLMRGPM